MASYSVNFMLLQTMVMWQRDRAPVFQFASGRHLAVANSCRWRMFGISFYVVFILGTPFGLDNLFERFTSASVRLSLSHVGNKRQLDTLMFG